jgi:hypothetical protein
MTEYTNGLDHGDDDDVLVEHHVDAPAATTAFNMDAATRKWIADCERVERLRQRYAPDAEPWQPAQPNAAPSSYPGWLIKAFKAEEEALAKAPPIVSADDVEAEVDRRLALEQKARRDALREEVASKVRRDAFEARMFHINVTSVRELEAREAAQEPARQRSMDEERARAIAKRSKW